MFWIIGGGAIFGGLHKIFDSPATALINKQLQHAEWVGFSFEDLIMPLFLFIAGVAMPFSFSKRLESGQTKSRLYLHIIKRVVILFILGMVVQGNLLAYDLSKLHIYCNTLQAIAAGYLIASLILLNLSIIAQAVITIILLLSFWALMVLVPVPGYGAGVLTQEGNLAIYLDKLILRGFEDGTPYTWILSSMTFAATVLIGVIAGQWLRSDISKGYKALGLAIAGVACITDGLLWGIWFPIIKHLWTSSFVLFSGGICLLFLATFYLIIDVWGFKKWAFGFIVIGSNAISVYTATRLFDFRQIADIFVIGLEKYLGTSFNLIQAVAAFIIIWLILWWIYKMKIFIKI